MKLKLIALILPLLAGANIHAASNQAQLLRAEDGDTLVVMRDGQQVRLQLAGMDAPEDTPNPKFSKDVERTGISQKELFELGVAATSRLNALLPPGAVLTVDSDAGALDKYGRLPAMVSFAGVSINQKMVADGYAIVQEDALLTAQNKQAWDDLERNARSSGVGLWSEDMRSRARAWANK